MSVILVKLSTDPVAGTTMGGGPSEGIYHPFRDPTLSIQERVDRAEVWLSFYFTKVVDLESVTHEFLGSRVALHEGPGFQTGSEKTPTLLKMSAEELAATKDKTALLRSTMPLLRSNVENFRRNFEKALFDIDGALPGVNVVVAWCDETMGDAVLAAKIIHDRLKAEQPEGKVRRDIKMYRLEGTNHFVSIRCFWDYLPGMTSYHSPTTTTRRRSLTCLRPRCDCTITSRPAIIIDAPSLVISKNAVQLSAHTNTIFGPGELNLDIVQRCRSLRPPRTLNLVYIRTITSPHESPDLGN